MNKQSPKSNENAETQNPQKKPTIQPNHQNENEKQIEIKTKNDESMENSIELPDSTSEIFSEIKGMFNSKEKEGTNSSGDNDNENENIEASVETENKKQGYKNKYTDKRISSDEKTSSGKK